MVKASLQIPKEVNTRIWLREPLERVWDQITEKRGEKKSMKAEKRAGLKALTLAKTRVSICRRAMV